MIVILENVEYHVDVVFFLIFFYGFYRDLSGNVIRKVKLARAYTAKRDTFQIIFHCFVQAGKITAFEQLAVVFRKPAADDRTDGMDNISARQIISGCDFRLTRPLLVTLLFHQLITGVSKLYARVCVDDVVDTAVAGNETAEHFRIGGVDYHVAFQRGDVALPKIDVFLQRFQISYICNALARCFFLQILVLNLQKILADSLRHTDIEQRAQ